MGLLGLSLSTTLVYLFMAITLFLLLNKKIHFFTKKEYIFILKLIIYGIICFTISTLIFSIIPAWDNLILKILRTGASAAGGLIAYGLLILIFDRKELTNGKAQ